MIRRDETDQETNAPFAGFASPTSNTLYCPNQFFDVCLRHNSRGCIRVVAHLLRETLGWSDREGRPLRDRHAISYGEFAEAGIGKDTIKSALSEAIQGKFIRCISAPLAAGKGKTAVRGMYELNWDESGEYVKDPKAFNGFFAGEGCRTYIPNAYFDQIITHEPLAVVKVVGAVIRFSIGFQTKWGHRRQHVALSFTDIQRYARIASRTGMSFALAHALRANYLTRVSEGYFDPHGGMRSAKACYGLKWLSEAVDQSSTRKCVPGESEPINHSENRTGGTRKCVPAKHSEMCTGIKITDTNNNIKQQRSKTNGEVRGADEINREPTDIAVVFEELKRIGFDQSAARHLAAHHPAHLIMYQIELADRGSSNSNRLGLLRRAIERNWAAPMPSAGRTEFGRPKSRSPNEGDRQGTSTLSSLADILADHFKPGSST